MASAFTHAFAALALGGTMAPRLPRSTRAFAAVLAVLPDIDVAAFAFGVPYADPLGHRGLTHSLAFAAVVGVLAAVVVVRARRAPSSLAMTAALFVTALASHGVLDAMTSGGLGVGFFIPFSDARYFFPWRPLEVSPVNPAAFAGARAAAILASEIAVVWLPLGVVWLAASLVRRRAVT